MRTSLTVLCSFLLGCSGSINGSKSVPDEEPLVDVGSADSLRAPKLRGAILPGGQAADDFTKTSRYHGFTLTLAADQTVNLRLGGVAADGSVLDTVLYLYGPADAKGHRARVDWNDDRSWDDLGSKLSVVAPSSGEYLVVATTYYKPDAGHYALLVGCPDGPCDVPLGPDSPKPSPRFSVAPYANPEVLAYFQLHFGDNADPAASWPAAHVDGLTGLLAADAVEDGATGAVAASDAAYLSQVLFAAGPALTTAQSAQIQSALDAYLGTPAHFAKLSPHAQEINLLAQSWDAMQAPDPAALAGVTQKLVQSWPGSSVDHVEVMPVGKGGKLYGFNIDVTLQKKDSSGTVTLIWDGLESFGPTGVYLGDFSLPPHPPGQG